MAISDEDSVKLKRRVKGPASGIPDKRIRANITGCRFVAEEPPLNNHLIAAHLNQLWQRVRELEDAVTQAGIALPDGDTGQSLLTRSDQSAAEKRALLEAAAAEIVQNLGYLEDRAANDEPSAFETVVEMLKRYQ